MRISVIFRNHTVIENCRPALRPAGTFDIRWGGPFLPEHLRIPRKPSEYTFRQNPSRAPRLRAFDMETSGNGQKRLQPPRNARKRLKMHGNTVASGRKNSASGIRVPTARLNTRRPESLGLRGVGIRARAESLDSESRRIGQRQFGVSGF
jgi:hypothetical protein